MARDLEGSKEAIVAAAEALFAEKGYEGASLQEIATVAGVSRGMPGYAFGSKRRLYDEVMRRALAEPAALAEAFVRALGHTDPASALRGAVDAYVDFLAAHPTYVRLLQRAALDGPEAGGGSVADGGIDPALAGATALAEAALARTADPRQLVISVIALCFFPFAHAETLLRPLGFDGRDPGFIAARKAHVVELLLHGLGPDPS